MDSTEIVIRNEQDAWLWLERLQTEIVVDEHAVIRFDGWPVLKLDFKGRDFHSSVPSRLMPPVMDLQKELNRTFCLLKYGEDNLRKLTNEDRDSAEIVVDVAHGSSIFDVKLDEQFNAIISAALDKMNPQDILITVVTIALSVTAASAWKAWLASKAREKEIEIGIRMSEQETARAQIMATALSQSEPARIVSEGMDEVRNHAFYRLKPQDTFTMPQSDVVVDGNTAAQLSHAPREESVEVRIDGEFKIFSVDSGNMAGYRIKVYRLSDGIELAVRIPQDGAISVEQRELIKHAEWAKEKLLMQINARELRGKITSATLVSVSKPRVDVNVNVNVE